MNILEFIIASFFIISLPGQDVMYLISQSISNSRKAGIITALGLAAGNIVHTTAIAFGFALLVSQSPEAITAIKFVGAAYLLYLSYVFFKDKSLLTIKEIDNKTAVKLFFQGVAMNVLNAKAWLFAVLFFPQFLNPASLTPKLDVFILGGIFIAIAAVLFTSFAIIASILASKLINSERAANTLRYIKSAIMLVIAVYMFV